MGISSNLAACGRATPSGLGLLLAVGCVSTEPPKRWDGQRLMAVESPAEPWLVDLDCPTPLVRYADADGDGHGAAAIQVEVCEETPGFVDDATDCDDLRADISPSAPELCGDALDHDCNGVAEACPQPDLDVDAAAVTQGDEVAFGETIAGGLRFDGDDHLHAVMGSMSVTGDTALDVDAGLLWEFGDPDLLVAGAEVELEAVETGRATGRRHSGIGRALAAAAPDGAETPSRLYAAAAGPVETEAGWASCGLYWFDRGLPDVDDFVQNADGYLPCDVDADPDLTHPGLDAVAAGFWDGEGIVVATSHPVNQAVWVLRGSDRSIGVPLDRYGITVLDVDKVGLGTGLAWADLDGDALDDLVVTAPERSQAADDGGGFDVYTGDSLQARAMPDRVASSDLGFGVASTIASARLGVSVAAVDLDGDGLDEIVVGGASEDPTWSARVLVVQPGVPEVYGGARLSVEDLPEDASYTWLLSDTAGDDLGRTVAAVGDDGLAVGAPRYGGGDGRVYTFAPAADFFDSVERNVAEQSAAVIDTNRPGEGLGAGLSSAGDADADGTVDLWMLADGVENGAPRAVLLFDTRL